MVFLKTKWLLWRIHNNQYEDIIKPLNQHLLELKTQWLYGTCQYK